jgi:OmpA-OmpF porin, OOP family
MSGGVLWAIVLETLFRPRCYVPSVIRTLAIILLVSLARTVTAQTNEHVQWASEVLDLSSEVRKTGEKGYGADQALGKPNKCPAPGDSPCAWAPAGNSGEEWIKVGFERPMKIVQVVVAENFNPDAISKIVLYDEKDRERDSYPSQPEAQGVGPHMHHLIINRTSYNVAAVKVVLQVGVVPGPSEIDAIGISDAWEKVEAEVNVAPDIRVGPRENLGPGVNSQYDEVLPVISPDGKTLFVDRKNHPQNIRAGNAPFSPNEIDNDNIWYSQLDARNNWQPLINIGPQLNRGFGSFVSSVTPDGNTLLLGGTFPSQRLHHENSGLWLSHRTKTGWSTPEEVIVRDFYTKAQTAEFCLSNDGRTIVLALDRADSRGRKDLYVSFLTDDETWSAPKSLGPVVNSVADEMTPFLAADGKTLYFSSDGYAGYGGLDMFITRRLDDSWQHWTEPQNLGPQLNTPGWDAYYTLPASGEYAYFVSTENSYGAGDIFRVKLPESLKPQAVVLISGKVLEAKSGKPIGAAIKYEDLATGKEIGSASTNPTTGIYKITLPAGRNYGYRAEAAGYIPISENLDLTNEKSYHELERDLTLVPFEKGEVVRVNNIFFETGKATLRPESSPELDRIVKLLKEHPTMEIAIAGHTDSVGTPSANLQLSEDRAVAVQAYLIGKGIAAKRLRTHGYGETQPIAPNTTESGRQQNRRVEFTIVKQ